MGQTLPRRTRSGTGSIGNVAGGTPTVPAGSASDPGRAVAVRSSPSSPWPLRAETAPGPLAPATDPIATCVADASDRWPRRRRAASRCLPLHRLDGSRGERQGYLSMKTISVQEAAREFDRYAREAHEGERILVTQRDEPWVVLAPPTTERRARTVKPLTWPDFAARLHPFYTEVVPGPTATELLAQDKEDRF